MFGQIPDFTNSFEFLRNMWARAAGMPSGLMPGLGAMTPPMDLDEVDKRIHDLKAVESWLQLNVNLLRTTIQGLEVQRATLVALQTFGNALSPEAMQSAMENVARAANAPSAHPPQHPHHFADSATVSEEQADAENDEPDDDDEAPPDDDRTRADAADRAASANAADRATSAADGAAPLPPNAALWWDLLQRQFTQIASSAAAASTMPFGNVTGMPGMAGMPGMPGFGAGAAGAEGVEPQAAGAAGTRPGASAADKPKPAAKKPAVKKPAARTTAAKPKAKPAAKKSSTKPSSNKRPAGSTPAPGTPEDTFE
ncbi:PhaM family polyhydroxyalkanoate granule multifunctional regulatory protein [Cupriavidus pauculus]|uniref:PhaM family polyhydroxyalkanoate granule multifunctional regulatory protein n=1 Tax=Cupriavidus pauculus TaxID=82633 RepID=UPI00385770D5